MKMVLILGILNYIYSEKRIVKTGSRKVSVKTLENKNTTVNQKKITFDKTIKPARAAKHTFVVDTAIDSKQFYSSIERLGVVIK